MAPFDRSCTSSYLRSVIRFDPWSYLVSSATLGKILVEYRDSLKPQPAFDASECEGGGSDDGRTFRRQDRQMPVLEHGAKILMKT